MMDSRSRKWTITGIVSLVAVPAAMAVTGQAPAAHARTRPAAPVAQVSSSARTNMSYALYKARGGRITTGFDGYVHTPGRHEGIDFARRLNAPVHSLVNGKIIYIARGGTGRAGLSTISIYIAYLRKTVIYLHTAPLRTLRTGQSVRHGQVIAVESWHGVKDRPSAHTHVEMRPGWHKHAADSTHDDRLDNPNPGPFWNSLGYNVR
ncbi:M23 family metallopeptidase [Actinomadura roseirufa]|uniref:M23 family metallopeptidase n=1 Tax=Actinomadura roseirufa TaxID=2094049 RepID=UPI00104156EB|nr:M23 family metallopeptidase [Actinomadura roseirufa]